MINNELDRSVIMFSPNLEVIGPSMCKESAKTSMKIRHSLEMRANFGVVQKVDVLQ